MGRWIFRRVYRAYLIFVVLLTLGLLALLFNNDLRAALREWLRGYAEPDAMLSSMDGESRMD